jgi:O-antigen ligase
VPYNSTLFAMIFSLFPYLFITAVLSKSRTKWLAVHLGALGVAIAGMAIWALIQFFFLFDVYGPRIHHPMLNPNNLAAIFNLCLFPALGLFFYVRKKSHQILAFSLVMLLLVALFITQSRGALLAFAIALILFLAFVYKNKSVTGKKVLMLLSCGAALFWVVNHESSGRLSQTLVSLPTDRHSVVERQLIWGATWDIIKPRIWSGTGLGTFYYYYPSHRDPKDMSDGYFTHMDPLQFWAEMGVLAPILFYGILICVLILTLKATRKSVPEGQDRLWLYASFCGLLTLAGHTHVSFHLYMPPPLIVAALLMAFWYDRVVRIVGDKELSLSVAGTTTKKLLLKAVLFLVLAAPIIWLSFAALGVHYAGKASALLQQNKSEEGYQNILLAQKYAPDTWEKPYDLQMRYRIHLLTKAGALRTPQERKKTYEEALLLAAQARMRNPAFATLWNNQAMVHFLSYPDIDPHGRAKAIVLLKETLKHNPLLVDARLGLSRIYRVKGEFKKAHSILMEATRYPMPISYASVNLYKEAASISLHLGNEREAKRIIAQANSFSERIQARQNRR